MGQIAWEERGGRNEAADAAVMAARVGYATRGFLYVTAAVLALLVMLGQGGELTDNKGALRALHLHPLGDAVVGLCGVGLVCYAVWSFVRAVVDPEHSAAKARTWRRVLVRIGYAIVGLVHGALAVYAFQLVFGSATRDTGAKGATSQTMSLPFGRWLVAIVGVSVLGVGISQLVRALANRLGREYRASGLRAPHFRVLERTARAGVGVRGVVFALAGASLVLAAFHARPAEARGVADVLRELLAQPFGHVLMGAVALGLLAFGLVQGAIACFGDLPRPD